MRAEHLLGFLRPIPIALRDRRTLNQNLADFAVGALVRRVRIDDDDRVSVHRRAAADEPLHHRVRLAAGRRDAMLGQRGPIHGQNRAARAR